MNPFTEAIYNIYESTLWSSCKNAGTTSRIVSSKSPPPGGSYTKIITLKDLFYIEKYISEELSKFVNNINLLNRCDNYTTLININPNVTLPTACNTTFNNFSHEKIATIRKDTKYNKKVYHSQITFGDKPFDNITYTNSYLTSKTNSNDKKEICQQFSDVSQLLTDYKNILDSINTTTNKNTYTDDYNLIMTKYNANLVLRNELTGKVNELYSDKGSRIGNSKLYLDSTVYTSVLWTILATTVLFYIFKKM
jgi:hypothetical protein